MKNGVIDLSIIIIKRKLNSGLKIRILFSCDKKNIVFTVYSLCSFLKYCFCHSKIQLISLRRHVISSIYLMHFEQEALIFLAVKILVPNFGCFHKLFFT